MKIKTLKDLKKFLGTLDDNQLANEAVVERVEEPPVHIKSAGTTEVDMFYNGDSEGLIPVSEYEEEDWGFPLESDENTIVKAGQPYLLNE